MSYLIVYMSHHGTTRRVAYQLGKALTGEEVTLVNLEDDPVPALNDYSTIIIGGSIHMGCIQKGVRKFCEEHEATLLEKNLGLFLCFMNKEEGMKEFEHAFPESLRKASKANGLFGGELLFEEMNIIERFIIRKITGVTETTSEIDQEAIETFLRLIHE